jgi:hypothetical protein
LRHRLAKNIAKKDPLGLRASHSMRMALPEWEDREIEKKILFKETMGEIVLKLLKNVNLHIQNTWQTPNRKKWKETYTQGHHNKNV